MFVIQYENVMVLSIPIRLERMQTIFKAHVKIINIARKIMMITVKNRLDMSHLNLYVGLFFILLQIMGSIVNATTLGIAAVAQRICKTNIFVGHSNTLPPHL